MSRPFCCAPPSRPWVLRGSCGTAPAPPSRSSRRAGVLEVDSGAPRARTGARLRLGSACPLFRATPSRVLCPVCAANGLGASERSRLFVKASQHPPVAQVLHPPPALVPLCFFCSPEGRGADRQVHREHQHRLQGDLRREGHLGAGADPAPTRPTPSRSPRARKRHFLGTWLVMENTCNFLLLH